jgi:hypothetical protein
MSSCSADIARVKERRPGFLPLMVGLHWPSEPWGDDTFPNVESFGIADVDPVNQLVDAAAGKIVDTPAARAALQTIIRAAFADNSPSSLPTPVRDAYDVLDKETGLGHDGSAAPPGDDRDPFDAESLYQDGRTEAVSFGGFSDGVLAPLRVLSFWKMKDRARRFGESSAHRLLSDLMGASGSRDVKFHLMGHSFGCIVVSAIGPVRAAQRCLGRSIRLRWSSGHCRFGPIAPTFRMCQAYPAISAPLCLRRNLAGRLSRRDRFTTVPSARGILGPPERGTRSALRRVSYPNMAPSARSESKVRGPIATTG